MKYLLFIICTAVLLSCSNTDNQDEIQQLKEENQQLRVENDSLKNYIRIEEEKKNILGVYVNTQVGLYSKVEIKGETTCIVTDGIFNMPFASSYEKDGSLIRVKTDQSDMLFTIKDSETLIGEGFAEGVYIKQ